MKKLITLLLIAILSGCSIKMELGYHGKTATDSQIATPELVRAKNRFFQQ